jgi:electron transport complex protein RnfG
MSHERRPQGRPKDGAAKHFEPHSGEQPSPLSGGRGRGDGTMSDMPAGMPPSAPPSLVRISSRTAATLLLFTVAFTVLMALTYRATKPLLDANAQAEKLKLINEILPAAAYDNDLLADAVTLPPMAALGTEETTRLYRARRGGEPVALVLESMAPDGYSGRIGLVLAVRADGRLAALRVTGHRETPGLGDYIDPKKDKHKDRPWIKQFDNLGADLVAAGQWKVKKDGGRFDYMAGATISPRAVVNASGRALAWAATRRDKLFALPVGTTADNLE